MASIIETKQNMKTKLIYPLFLWVLLLGFTSCDQTQYVKDDNGKVIESFTLNDNGEKEGPYKKFFSDGEIEETAFYKNGKLDGDRKMFYLSGQVETHEKYNNDVIDGDCIDYHENGQTKMFYHYDQGLLINKIKKYSDNGVLLEVVQMKEGEENGPFKEFFLNGKIKWEGQYLNGDNEFGLLKEYNEEGNLIKKMMCDSFAVCRTIWTLENGDIKLEPLNLNLKTKKYSE